MNASVANTNTHLKQQGSFFPLSVLIVDDDPIAGEELSEALEEFGFRCFIATSYREAIETAARETSITAVVTDFYLRGTENLAENGLDLIESLQDAFPDRALDCIVVSGDPEILGECTMHGAYKFLSKPIAPESLSSMLLEPRPAAEAQAGSEEDDNAAVSVVLLHRLVESQQHTITTLTDALKANQKDAREMRSRLGRLLEAARIAGRRSARTGDNEVRTLIGYIVGQGAAVKDLLPRNADRKPARSDEDVNVH